MQQRNLQVMNMDVHDVFAEIEKVFKQCVDNSKQAGQLYNNIFTFAFLLLSSL